MIMKLEQIRIDIEIAIEGIKIINEIYNLPWFAKIPILHAYRYRIYGMYKWKNKCKMYHNAKLVPSL